MDFKKIIFIFYLFVGFSSFAQKRLEFNRIVSLSGYLSANYSIQLDTVAIGKALKITSFNTNDSKAQLKINGTAIGSVQDVTPFNLPVWLKAGDILGVYSSYTGSVYQISGIEFNIVE